MAVLILLLVIVSAAFAITSILDTREIRKLKLENKAQAALIDAYEPLRIEAMLQKEGSCKVTEASSELSQKENKAQKSKKRGKAQK